MKIVFLGDSITEGCCATSQDNNYVSLIGKRFNATVVNYGVSGTRIAPQIERKDPPDFDKDFLFRSDGIENDADAVVVFGGVNDYGHGDAPIGSFAVKDKFTFYGATRLLCENLLKKYPRDKILFVLPLGCACDDKPCGKSSMEISANLSRYVDILKEITTYYGIKYLDLFHVLPNPADNKGNEWFADQVHPNDKGHKWLADKVSDCLVDSKIID